MRGIRPELAAVRIDVEPSTLSTWRRRGVGPPFFRLPSGAIRYDAEGLEEWLAKYRVPRGCGPRGNVSIEI